MPKVNLDLAKTNNDNVITDELKSNLGSLAFELAHDRFFGSTDMRIWTGAGETGTQLTDGVDYSVQGLDADLTAESVAQIYSEVIILNVTYQTGNLYFNYHAAADEVDALDRYVIKPPAGTTFQVETTGAGDIDLEALGTGDILLNKTGVRNTGVSTSTPTLIFSVNEKSGMTVIGGFCVKLTNKTGANSIAGYCVTNDDSTADAVKLVPINVPNCIGVFLESGIADGEEAWIVTGGIANVYFWSSTTLGHLARTGLTADTGEVSGQALSEAVPTSPFANDKHFCEIGHVIESRVGAGLARIVMHFN